MKNQSSTDLLDILMLLGAKCNNDLENIVINCTFEDGTTYKYNKNIYDEFVTWEQYGMGSPMLQSQVISIKNKLSTSITKTSLNYKCNMVITVLVPSIEIN